MNSEKSKQYDEDDNQLICGFDTKKAELEISELFQNDGNKFDMNELMDEEQEVEE